ncbi:MAG TPA: hydrogenase maturation protease, partial [Anaeromyxobacteraceae bacterium]|nr:hydrogenase maturation protease [Anaeromyxobacteraceae bacterium]
MSRVLVACLGSGLAGDSAAGSAVHSLLQGCTLPEGARLALVRPGAMRLLEALRGEEAVVAVGEVELGARPGTLHVLDWREVPFGADGHARSGNALRVTMEASRIRDPSRAPRTAFLVGIEGRAFGGHEGLLHPEVAAALAGAARVVLDLVHGLAGLDAPPADGEGTALSDAL